MQHDKIVVLSQIENHCSFNYEAAEKEYFYIFPPGIFSSQEYFVPYT